MRRTPDDWYAYDNVNYTNRLQPTEAGTEITTSGKVLAHMLPSGSAKSRVATAVWINPSIRRCVPDSDALPLGVDERKTLQRSTCFKPCYLATGNVCDPGMYLHLHTRLGSRKSTHRGQAASNNSSAYCYSLSIFPTFRRPVGPGIPVEERNSERGSAFVWRHLCFSVASKSTRQRATMHVTILIVGQQAPVTVSQSSISEMITTHARVQGVGWNRTGTRCWSQGAGSKDKAKDKSLQPLQFPILLTVQTQWCTSASTLSQHRLATTLQGKVILLIWQLEMPKSSNLRERRQSINCSQGGKWQAVKFLAILAHLI